MLRSATCAAILVSLVASCAQPSAPNLWTLVDPQPVRDWCEKGAMPERLPSGLWTCSAVTEGDARRLSAHKKQVEGGRAGDRR